MDIIAKEQRANIRKLADKSAVQVRPLDPQAWFRYWNGTECFLRDFTLFGAGIYSKETMAVGTRLSIDILLNETISPIRVFGKVEWTYQDADKYRSGISFSWWKNDQNKKIVDDFLEGLELSS
ncbi:MAG: PilZ domain-containing protein [Candidatus Omnitrophota bacterium]